MHVEQEQGYECIRRQSRWEYKTKEELERDSPSRKCGLSPEKEARWTREMVFMLQKAGMQLRIPQWGIAIAATLCHRFYARKSMKKNDRFVSCPK
ncbi:cyclin N-terminal domain-containing protein [Haematococcus lacustris]|uniref:Cyclin N-terminal domain-containing protein n=1 Tax=Haematococcus lacustris TaxID=44745 RepID=A0A699YU64_HAELA|nr:cyclin N-terminal domain-containing protein [Haematococcus lacustris]